jgi:hypothetical protein
MQGRGCHAFVAEVPRIIGPRASATKACPPSSGGMLSRRFPTGPGRWHRRPRKHGTRHIDRTCTSTVHGSGGRDSETLPRRGRMVIAQHFQCWVKKPVNHTGVPEGRLNRQSPLSAVPPALDPQALFPPSTGSAGLFSVRPFGTPEPASELARVLMTSEDASGGSRPPLAQQVLGQFLAQ